MSVEKSILDGIPVHTKGFPARDMVQPPTPFTCPKCGVSPEQKKSPNGAIMSVFPCDCFKQVKSFEQLVKSK